MVFKILCILIFWVKVALALKGLEHLGGTNQPEHVTDYRQPTWQKHRPSLPPFQSLYLMMKGPWTHIVAWRGRAGIGILVALLLTIILFLYQPSPSKRTRHLFKYVSTHFTRIGSDTDTSFFMVNTKCMAIEYEVRGHWNFGT